MQTTIEITSIITIPTTTTANNNNNNNNNGYILEPSWIDVDATATSHAN